MRFGLARLPLQIVQCYVYGRRSYGAQQFERRRRLLLALVSFITAARGFRQRNRTGKIAPMIRAFVHGVRVAITVAR